MSDEATAEGEPAGDVDQAAEKPRIKVTTGPETWRCVLTFVQGGQLPDTYVTRGRLVHVERVSGYVLEERGDKDSPLPVMALDSTADLLATWLAQHAYVYKTETRESHTREVETFPSDGVLRKVLAGHHWPGVPPLLGIIGAPVLRPDGTLLQENGYDPKTGLYLEKKVPLGEVPEKPTPEQVDTARRFVCDELLGEFPWKSKADKANYIAVLVTQILRPYLRTLVPLVIVTATTPSSGKTILTAATGMLYGQKLIPWPHDEVELGKTLTTAFSAPAGVVVFDNAEEGTVIDSPKLAALMTTEEWSDRAMGGNQKMLTYTNDRVWIVTGNNLQLGGDMGSRAILVSLDPNMANPEERTGFTIPNLDGVILQPQFRARVLWHLLVLVLDWVNSGARKKHGLTMRQFTPWLEAVGGFLDHHGIEGFFDNRAETREINEADATWRAFLETWHELHGSRHRFRPHDLRRTAEGAPGDPADDGVWRGNFLKSPNGRVVNATWLGRQLRGRLGRHHGQFVLRSVYDGHAKGFVYWVEKTDDDGPFDGGPKIARLPPLTPATNL